MFRNSLTIEKCSVTAKNLGNAILMFSNTDLVCDNLLEARTSKACVFSFVLFTPMLGLEPAKVPHRPARISRLSPSCKHVWCHHMQGHLYMKGLLALKYAFKRRKRGYRTKSWCISTMHLRVNTVCK
jgi:hypothetical protein